MMLKSVKRGYRNFIRRLFVHFEGRELKPYAEPVSKSELRGGETYFAVNYVDDEMLTPVMETLVFIGRNLEPEDIGQAYFQDIESFREGIAYGWTATDDGSPSFCSGSE